ncbi:MAG: TIR domain-containing protein [Nostoc sp.]|uniref:WD40 domain-containing protein n=1 Tax=Nostoc sp. TaxID=1180 RepID=UPI002FEFBCA2
MVNQPKYDVFLAHNSLDKPEVRKIFEKLKKCGLNPWLDEDAILPGRSFQKEIQDIILKVESAAIFISDNGLGKWQSMELNVLMSECLERNTPLIPVLLPGFDKSRQLELLPFLRQFNWVDISKNDEKEFDRLIWGINGAKRETIQELKPDQKPGIISKKTVEEKRERYLEILKDFINISELIDSLSKEIMDSKFDIFNKIPLPLPQQKDKNETIIYKIKEKLHSLMEEKEGSETSSFPKEEMITSHLIKLLKAKKKEEKLSGNYAAGNLINLLLQLGLKTDFSYFDLSNISIKEADFRKAILTGVDFSKSDLENSIFFEPLGCIHSIAFNADGSYFATGDAHGSIRVHNTDNLELCYFKNERRSQIWSVAFCPNPDHSQILAWGAEDGTVSLSKIIPKSSSDKDKTIEMIYLSDKAARILSLAFSPDGKTLAIGGDGKNNAINLYSMEDKTLRSLSVASNVYCMTFINNRLLASGNSEGNIEIWDLNQDENKKTVRKKKHHKGIIRCIAFNSQQNIIASGGEDGKVILFEYRGLEVKITPLLVKTEDTSIKQVRTLAFSHDGNILAVGCIDNTAEGKSEHKIRQYDLIKRQWSWIDDSNEHEHLIRSVAFCPNLTDPQSEILISGGDERTVKLWDWDNKKKRWIKRKQALSGYANRIWSVALFNQDCKTFACGGEDNQIRLWNYYERTHIPTEILSQGKEWVWSVAFNKDRKLLASGSENGKIYLWELDDNKKWQYIPNENLKHEERVRCVVFNPAGDMLASAGNDKTIFLWNVTNVNAPELLKKFPEHKDRVLSLAFSPNGDYLASSSRNTTIYLRELNPKDTEKPLIEKPLKDTPKYNHTDQVHSIAFSPDSTKLVSGGFDKKLKLWEVSSRTCLKTWTEDQKILSVAFNPKKLMIASAGHGGFITLWNIIEKDHKWTSEIYKILKGHKLAVESVVFSPDGDRLISCSQDQTIKFWDVEGEINISIHTIELGNLYQGMNISGVSGLDKAQIETLEELGASSY